MKPTWMFAGCVLWIGFGLSALAQPPAIQVGDKVTVNAAATKLMAGQNQVGTLPKGTQFTVEKISGVWLQATVKLGGQQRSGWVSIQDVTIASMTSPAPAASQLPNRGRPQIELEPWDRPFVFNRRDELEIKAGDTVIVSRKASLFGQKDGAPLYQPDGRPLRLTKGDYNKGDDYLIPHGTSLKVRRVSYEFGPDLPRYHVTIEAGGQKWDGYLNYDDVVKQNRYEASRGRFNPITYDSAWWLQNFQRNLPRFDLSHDAAGMLYGTTPIKQGLHRRVTFDLNVPDVSHMYERTGYETYLSNAHEDRDISTRREPGTEQLLVQLPPIPDWDEFFQRLANDFARAKDAALKNESSDLSSLRSAIADLRAAGKYDEANQSANSLLKKCRIALGENHWRTRESALLKQTLERILTLKDNARWEITQSDATNLSLLQERDDSLKSFLLAVDQRTVRRDHLGNDCSDSIAATSWLAFLLRGAAGQDVESLHLEVIDRVRKILGDAHPWTARAISNLALVRMDRADHGAAQKLLAFTVNLLQKHHQLATLDGVLILANLGRACEQQGQREPSLRAFALSRDVSRSLSPNDQQRVHRIYMAELATLDHETASQVPLALRAGLAYRPSLTNYLVPFLIKRNGNWTGGTTQGMLQTTSIDSLSFAGVGQAGSTKADAASELTSTATAMMLKSDYAAAERVLREAYRLTTTRKVGDDFQHSMVCRSLAVVLSIVGSADEASKYQNRLPSSVRSGRRSIRKSRRR